jgi:tetratricopeptide (TPR) repeat protein
MATGAASRIVLGLVLALPLAATRVGAAILDAGAITHERLGSVSFPVSCSTAVQADFNRGVALLHDFWYDEARPQFARILKADPSCAMAHWGLALSGFHQIWDIPDAAGMAAGWREMQAAQAIAAKTNRERDYIAALSAFFSPGNADFQTRIDAYVASLGQLYARYPKDVDAGAFYALALLAAETPNDVSLSQERKALVVLMPLWHENPDHPGLVHYIIHACDSPSLAVQGLPAAQRYSSLAASGPHAVHMPGHIFARLGMWSDDIRVNRASVAASQAAEARHENGWMDQFHSDDFLSYAYLQSGQEARARAVIDESAAAIAHYQSMPGMADDGFMTALFFGYRTKLPLFYDLETRDWRAATQIAPVGGPPYVQTQIYWGRAIGDGHLHRARQAREDLAAYDALEEQIRKGDHAYAAHSTGAKISRGEILAWVDFAAGNVPGAIAAMRASADLQDKVGQGEVDIPAREMLADILFESGQPAAALIEYQQALQLSPKRFNGLWGAGRAAQAAGDTGAARQYYAELLKTTHNGAYSGRPEIRLAKEFVAAHPVTTQ